MRTIAMFLSLMVAGLGFMLIGFAIGFMSTEPMDIALTIFYGVMCISVGGLLFYDTLD